ncbi:MAG: FHA domain-containing protein [Deltaproteobacteria bacterium]|nr:FHA domain-containing protein [Deltaproteobacteria bacterium]
MNIRWTLLKNGKKISEGLLTQLPITLGRGATCEIVLDEQHISREHAAVILEEDSLKLVKKTATGKVFFENIPLEKETALTLPATFEIPPFTILLENKSIPETSAGEAVPVIKSETEESLEDFPIILDETMGHEKKAVPKSTDETMISSHRIKAKLMVLEGKSPHTSYDLQGKEMVIGRDAACDLFLDDDKISREHAKILLQAEGYVLEDLNSMNGTYVNHQKITSPHLLKSSDHIQLGDSVLQFALCDEDIVELSFQSPTTLVQADTALSKIVPEWRSPSPRYGISKMRRTFTQRQKMLFALGALGALLIVYTQIQPPRPASDPTLTVSEGPLTRVPSAKDELSHLTKIDKEYVLAKLQEAKAAYKNRQYLHAQIATQEALNMAPQYVEAIKFLKIVNQTLSQQNFFESQRKAKIEEEKLKEDIKLHLAVALDYFNRGQWQKAVEAYDKILELEPEHPEAAEKRSVAQEKLTVRKPQQEPKDTSMLQKNKKAEDWLSKGAILDQNGKKLQALEVWRKVLKMEGIDPKHYAKAEQFITMTKAQLEQQHLAAIHKAKNLLDSKEYMQAKEIIEVVLKEYPSHPEAQKLLDRIFVALHGIAKREYTEAVIDENVGRVDQAIQRFRWIVEHIPPSDEFYEKAQRKLKKYE